MAKAGGLPTMIYSCGKERVLADMLVRHTDIDMINPVEGTPMGNVHLAELKAAHGRRLAIMGNLHTTDVMLHGTADEVRRESLLAILAAGTGGGFILSASDQCGPQTPEQNLTAMVDTAKDFGSYPLYAGR